MTHALYYPPADRVRQWAYPRFPGNVMDTNTVVLHTTETTDWPGYGTGYWPNLTYHPGAKVKWRQHLPLNRSGRALENRSGGVETNTLNCVQIEMVGTCDAAYHRRYGGMFYDDPSDEVIEDLARFAAFMHDEWDVELVAAPKWLPYPDSYGNRNGQRFTAEEWLDFYGWCGHEHVAENRHGDPGAFPIHKVLDRAKVQLGVAPQPEPKPKPIPQEDPMANPAQLVRVEGDAAIYAVTLSGARHIKNPTHLDLLRKSGQVTEDIEPVTKAQLAELLEVE